MGTWGVAIFDNDDALDWGYELEETDDLSLIIESLVTLTQVEDDEYIESPTCARALAASTVLACLRRGTPKGMPQEIERWCTVNSHLDGNPYRDMAVRAVERCRNDPNSELREQWADTPHFSAWQAALDDLVARLR